MNGQRNSNRNRAMDRMDVWVTEWTDKMDGMSGWTNRQMMRG